MRHLLIPLALTLFAAPVLAQTPDPAKIPATAVTRSDLSAELGEKGIKPVLDRLHGLKAPSPSERFATAGLEFLSAVESAYQWRHRYGVGEVAGMMLGSGADLPQIPHHDPMPPESFAQQTERTLATMTRARTALDGLAEGPDFGVTLDLGDLWFDVDGDGKRADWESAADLLDGVIYDRAFNPDFNPEDPDGDASSGPVALPVIRFDNSDAAWLTAYSHLISGGSELILAFDPTPSIKQVLDTREKIDSLRSKTDPDSQFSELYFLDFYLEPMAIAIDMLRHQPDAKRTRAAKAHWRETVAQNRILWRLIAAETDNAGEWIPGDAQVSATGLAFPQGMGPGWLAVLEDGDALLTGEKTIPFWRAPTGVNLAAWLENPTPLPLDGLIQGWAVAPFFSDKPTVDAASYNRFIAMLLDSDPFLTMIMLN